MCRDTGREVEANVYCEDGDRSSRSSSNNKMQHIAQE